MKIFRSAVVHVLVLAVSIGCADGPPTSATDQTGPLTDSGTVDGLPDSALPVDGSSVDLKTNDGAGPFPIKLPDDESPHNDPIEWWYYTGVMKTVAGATYGFELVTFQAVYGGVPVYLGHFAISDTQTKTFQLKTQSSVTDQHGPGPGFKLKLSSWEMSGHAGVDQLKADMPGYAINLSLTATKPMVLQYGTGWMTIGSDKPFYYYSYPQMALSGTLDVAGKVEAVTGTAWMDHQWGTMGTGYDGWDWFSLRLDDMTEVMLFVVRDGQSTKFVGGTYVRADGSYKELSASEFEIKAQGTWESPHTNATYPMGWSIKIPSFDLDLAVTPVFLDQEFYESTLGTPTYWEGLCGVSGKRGGQPVAGEAYVELTGYLTN
jgi:predicted secreted hydrolase